MPSNILFDLFQRYRFIQQIISIVNTSKADRILEVGAAGSPLRNLVPDRQVVMLDRCLKPGEIDLQADGLHLPFSDRSFQTVISTDTLEHMTPSDRVFFIQQLLRITSGVLILGFPHADVVNTEADKIFTEFVAKYSRGKFPDLQKYLNEHLSYGLPDAHEIRQTIQNSMQEIVEFKNSNIYSWLLFQIGNFAMLQHPEMEKLRTSVNDFFNEVIESDSHQLPCYRTFFVCSRIPFQQEVLVRLQAINTPRNFAAQEYAARALELVSVSAAAIREKDRQVAIIDQQKAKLQQEFNELEQKVLDQERRAERLRSTIRGQTLENQNLQRYLNLFLQHPAYKIYKFLKNSLQRVSKNHSSATHDIAYLLFQNTFEPNEEDWKRQSREWEEWDYKPALNIVTAVFGPPLSVFEETINSVLQQTYGRWVWNLVDASEEDTVWNVLTSLAARDLRVRPHRLVRNQGISGNINIALEQATGDYIVMLDHDDTIAPHALFSVAQAIAIQPDLDFIYSDSDKLDESGHRCEPLFKPDWSPEMLLSWNLLNQISVFRRSLLDQIGYLNPELDGAQDWDFYFRITERTQQIHHIPQILYHWRKTAKSTAKSVSNKPFAQKAQIRAISDHLQRTKTTKPEVFFIPGHPIHKTYPLSRWTSTRNWKISIIIPSKDRVHLLRKCLETVFGLTTYSNYEVIVVDTGSTEKNTHDYYDELKNRSQFRLISFREPFNFGKACNFGVSQATGDMLLFLNNDTEVLTRNWLERMLQWFEISGVGIVGAKLLFPNGKIQHAGVILGFGGLAGHLFANENENTSSIFGTDGWYRNVSAVTGACLMIRQDLFSRIGGFDDAFELIYSDVELCIRAAALGYRTVYSPEVRLLHHESATHERRIPRLDFENASQKWKTLLQLGDPYFNPNLTSTSARPSFKVRPDENPAQLNDRLMARLPKKETILLPGDALD